MNYKLAIYFIIVFCVFNFFRPLSAQNDIPILLNIDTINFEGELICRKTFTCDGNYKFYVFPNRFPKDTPQIREILYSDSTLRSRYFINIFPDIDHICIDYDSNGNIAYSSLVFQIEYKNMKYVCPVSSFYYEKGDILSSLYLQDLRGHLIVEYSCYNNGKWKWTPYHNFNPPKYAKKLFKTFKSQYQEKLYMLDKCIQYKP